MVCCVLHERINLDAGDASVVPLTGRPTDRPVPAPCLRSPERSVSRSSGRGDLAIGWRDGATSRTARGGDFRILACGAAVERQHPILEVLPQNRLDRRGQRIPAPPSRQKRNPVAQLRLANCREKQIRRLATCDPTLYRGIRRRTQQFRYDIRVQQHSHQRGLSRRTAARALVPAAAVQAPRRQAARFEPVWRRRGFHAACVRLPHAESAALPPPWTARYRRPARAIWSSPRRPDCGS